MEWSEILKFIDYYEDEILLFSGAFVIFTILLFAFTKIFWIYMLSMICQFCWLLTVVTWGAFTQSREKIILFALMTVCLAILNRTRTFQLRARISQLRRMMNVYKDVDPDRYEKYKEEYTFLTEKD